MDEDAAQVEIPVRNLYYLLCYAWDRLDEADLVDVGKIESNSLVELLSRVLATGTSHLLRRGLDRGYVPHEDATCSLRGRIDFQTSLKKNLFRNARAWCVFDELTYDVPHNQILKTTLRRLSRTPELNKKVRGEIYGLLRRIEPVRDIVLRGDSFRRVQLHRNNAFYGFLLNVCQILHEELLPEEGGESGRFRDFTRDEKKMALVFQHFVRNFYTIEQNRYTVSGTRLAWQRVLGDEKSLNLLPNLNTDVTLKSRDRTLVIDTKFYRKALTEHYGKKIYHPDHVNQIFVYVTNVKEREEKDAAQVEGMLLYPTVSEELDHEIELYGHRIRVSTVDLAQSWWEIRQRLLLLVG